MSLQGDPGVRISKLELENDYLLKHEMLALRTIQMLGRQSSMWANWAEEGGARRVIWLEGVWIWGRGDSPK